MQTNTSPNQTPNIPDGKWRFPASVDELTNRNVALIAELDATAKAKRTFTDRVADTITSFCGRIAFVWVHVIVFGLWISSNLMYKAHFDPYPFNLLSLVVSVEAIFLLSFLLISQNRQSRLSDRRNHLDLQINLLSEQENTKILSMLLAIQDHLGIRDGMPDTAVMLEAAQPANMVQQIEDMIEGENSDDGESSS